MLNGKTVLLGITGGIAAYKIPNLVSALVKQHCNVQVVMTENATQFITPLTFEALTSRKTLVNTFDRNIDYKIGHISLADEADLVFIAPATANVIAKLAHGLADDMLTTTVLACDCPKIIVPAMNTRMYLNQATQDNLEKLRQYGWQVIDPCSGRLACGVEGPGKMPEPNFLLEVILHELSHEKDMVGKKVLVTAGPTQEALDPVRYLTNHSTGKMGYAIAQAAAARGAQVTLVSGPTNLPRPYRVEVIDVVTAEEMFQEVTRCSTSQDIIIKAAAVADYRPARIAHDKMKKGEGELSIPLERTQDILAYLGAHRTPNQFLCGFSMETTNVLENSRAKLLRKNIDMIAANSLREAGAGFAGDTNRLTLITRDGDTPLPLVSKTEAAHLLLDHILNRHQPGTEIGPESF
ncbi:bifunctional phosphopantothenoylcysteine decarboxylase/phosphopantothenate--cysteine ligase CoaBC [Proteiniclasticum sp. QWL-01]|uniref:bifunctional phosphopantothenoylcysteine decarboxylase/phosphopantothenate--cysteine ligase CoaBC n=1 Tax=Proteiniclasticum sp. QWL-01 TaxID=3036945 RepID=UPI00240F4716|nr:bifunctional phosphopantothenoylcysteine decarboxylase/phosphopantothenate--cysteine ligase CoaBC [Proteiniclasticum sp. QWL-01]WFF72632.1 bifunctional phosphopantothenoylcysteine decarboxylase/phosphopantothenate--cysteine ligase CoaBC [Proteiniclasticum sp. QWL-01]